ncbi:PKD-like domain-containing protein [Mucilaginibacter antarcticus]|uniref:Ig-like domain-containing protein n=1 Tax=Mucilaginibacter antarcticus TaxID=1855725 RepID=UPI00363A4EF6
MRGQTATLTATGLGGNYSWYDVETGGTPLLANSPIFTTPALTSTKSFYVETAANGCTSSRTEVIVTVINKPLQPTVSGNLAVCSNSGTTLTATGPGTSFEWFDAAIGGNLVASGATFNTPALPANRSYFVQTSANGCSSTRTQVDILVNPTPGAPTVTPVAPVCAGNTTTLNASGAATLRWFGAASGGPVLGTGLSFTTPTLNSNTSYWVESYNGTCSSQRAPINITVTSTGNQFQYESATYCKTSTNPAPTITVPNGTFSGPAGLVINANTGVIDIAATTPGIYDIVYTNGCTLTTERVAIVVTTDATFTYPAAIYCQSNANPSPVYPSTGSAGKFTVSPAGLAFRNIRSGIIDLAASAPGNYIVKNTIDAASGCPEVSAIFNIRIDQRVIVTAGPNQTIAQGDDAQLAGSIGGAVTTGTWATAGTGTFLPNNSTLNAVYRPGTGESGPITLTLTSANPGTACGAVSNTVVITYNAKPGNPTFSGPATVCQNEVATLTATGPVADTYKWYTVASNGSAVFTGASFTTPALSTAGVNTYYLEAIVNNVPSNRTQIDITVTAKPLPPVSNAVVNTCYGSSARLTATSPLPAGVITWYRTISGGAPVFTGSVFDTPTLIANTTYYVQVAAGSCGSDRTKVDVIVKPMPHITSVARDETCNGAVNYLITADQTGTTFNWSRVPRPEISNADVTNQTNSTISETLINTTGATVDVTYRITPIFNGCSGEVFDYVVRVFSTPKVVSLPPAPICSKQISTGGFYTILFNTPITEVSWTRPAIAGISNPAVTNQRSPTLYENLENTSTAPITVTYIFTFSSPDCPTPTTYPVNVIVNPKVTINSPSNGGEICSGSDIVYDIRSDVSGANYIWTRRDDPRIIPAPTPTTANRIAEALTNISGGYVDVFYDIAATTGCQTPFTYKITIKPQPAQPQAFTNAPICVGSTLYLIPGPVERGSTYNWTGPNGYTSDLAQAYISNVTKAARGYIPYI